jgi:hypothetical protein
VTRDQVLGEERRLRDRFNILAKTLVEERLRLLRLAIEKKSGATLDAIVGHNEAVAFLSAVSAVDGGPSTPYSSTPLDTTEAALEVEVQRVSVEVDDAAARAHAAVADSQDSEELQRYRDVEEVMRNTVALAAARVPVFDELFSDEWVETVILIFGNFG